MGSLAHTQNSKSTKEEEMNEKGLGKRIWNLGSGCSSGSGSGSKLSSSSIVTGQAAAALEHADVKWARP